MEVHTFFWARIYCDVETEIKSNLFLEKKL